MTSIIVLFPRIEDAKNIRNLLVKNGFKVSAVCTTGAAVLNHIQELNDGVIVCGYKYPDMIFSDLLGDLPSYFDMLLLASRAKLDEAVGTGVMCVEMPLKVHELLNAVALMTETIERRRKKQKLIPKERSSDEKQILSQAKELLMVRNNMTEDEAHKYLQKTSMDSGTNMVETAQMVMSLFS